MAKKAIWAPEKHADVFMNGDSPIGIATDLGDLKIVSHGAVFDVVRQVPNRYPAGRQQLDKNQRLMPPKTISPRLESGRGCLIFAIFARRWEISKSLSETTTGQLTLMVEGVKGLVH